jgi:general secretion pathway protein H
MISPSKTAGAAGFTLLEVTIVLLVASLVVGLALSSSRSPVSAATKASLAAAEISGALRAARLQAITANTPVAVEFDIAGHRYEIGGSGWRTISPDVELSLLTTRQEVTARSSGRIRFAPDGSASGGRIELSGGGRTIWVGIDWLSGRVSQRPKP